MHVSYTKPTFAIGLILLLSACAYQGGDISNPLVRKANWFSFVGGEDLRAACSAGAPDMYRVVYNGNWDDQIRIYQIDSLQKNLRSTATRDANINAVFQDGLNSPQSTVTLNDTQYQSLVDSFANSGMFGPTPVGMDLPSRSYYWIASYCKDGQFGINAWKYPSDQFQRLSFPNQLAAYDQTNVAFAPARELPLDLQWEERRRKGQTTDFTLKLTKDGILR